MKRASYKEAVSWIGLNDSAAEDELDEAAVAALVSSVLVADLFDVPSEKVGRDVVAWRKKNEAAK